MIVLDTHVWIWWLNDPRTLSATAVKAIEKERLEGSIFVSSISVWEMAMLLARRRLVLSMGIREWVAKCELLPFLEFVPVSNSIAMRAVDLPGPFHTDPADRIIVATALAKGAFVITKDDKILSYPHVRSIW